MAIYGNGTSVTIVANRDDECSALFASDVNMSPKKAHLAMMSRQF